MYLFPKYDILTIGKLTYAESFDVKHLIWRGDKRIVEIQLVYMPNRGTDWYHFCIERYPNLRAGMVDISFQLLRREILIMFQFYNNSRNIIDTVKSKAARRFHFRYSNKKCRVFK